MNRNIQRKLLRAKREVGFGVLAPPPAIPVTTKLPTPSVIKWQGVVKVQRSVDGPESYLVYNKDRSVINEFKRSQYSRAEWSGIEKKFGLEYKKFWLATLHGDGTLEMLKPTVPESW